MASSWFVNGMPNGSLQSYIFRGPTNQRGRRAFDVFLAPKAGQLEAGDFELAQRMGKASFSLFRCTVRHEVAGVWLDDLLDGNRKLWLMDERMASAATHVAFGMRVFDAGEFHVGFGIAAPSDDETTEFSVEGVARSGRTPFRHSLAVTLYGDSLRGRVPLNPEVEDVFAALLAGLVELGAELGPPGWRRTNVAKSASAEG